MNKGGPIDLLLADAMTSARLKSYKLPYFGTKRIAYAASAAAVACRSSDDVLHLASSF